MVDSKTYYIPENEDVLTFLEQRDIVLSDASRRQLSFISTKTSNNHIGYYQFQLDGQYVKFFVVPKIHEKLDELDKEKAFFSFFSNYYRLAQEYPQIKDNKVKGNIIDMSFDKELEDKLSGRIDDFIRYKYEYALKILDVFFRKHTKTQHKHIAYASQSINNKIDLKNNIRSLNKANVHQTKREAEAYSEIALITEQVLKQFKAEKIEHIEHNKDVLLSKTNSVLNTIKKRFKNVGTFSFKDRDVITNRISKLFRGNKALKEVYEALLIIIGLEHFQSQDAGQEIQKLENMVALFFNPADLFEWIVYDKLRKKYEDKAEILKDKLDQGTVKKYSLSTAVTSMTRDSKPDFIVIHENKNVDTVDAKWKVLGKIEDIKFDDIAKLERDFLIRKDEYPSVLKAILIYPKIDFDYALHGDISNSYSTFKFRIECYEI
jgi:protein-arginine kinase activator protein McsA